MVCYAPGTGTLAAIGFAVYLIWHKAILHFFSMAGTTMEITLLLAAAALAAFVLVWTARMIRCRRAQAGACTTCRFRCQEALKARPNLLVNRVDRRVTPPAVARRAALACHPAAPLVSPLPRRLVSPPPAQPPRPPRPGGPRRVPSPPPGPSARSRDVPPGLRCRPSRCPSRSIHPGARRAPGSRSAPSLRRAASSARNPVPAGRARPSPMPPFPPANPGPSPPARWYANRPGRSKPSPSTATSLPRTA